MLKKTVFAYQIGDPCHKSLELSKTTPEHHEDIPKTSA